MCEREIILLFLDRCKIYINTERQSLAISAVSKTCILQVRT